MLLHLPLLLTGRNVVVQKNVQSIWRAGCGPRAVVGQPWPMMTRFLRSRQNPYLLREIRVWL